MKWRMNGKLAVALLAGAASAASAQSITTTFVSNNGGAALWTNYFDITVNTPLNITAMDVNTSAVAGTAFSIDVYTTAAGGTYVGNTSNPAVWTLQSTMTGNSAGQDQPSHTTGPSFSLPPGTYGMAIRFNTVVPRYTNGTGANQNYSTPEVSLVLGAAQATTVAPFNGGTPFTPRVWNGTIFYTVGGVTGACCRADGSCVVTTQSACNGVGGIYRGDNSPCATANCPQPATGACCFATDGMCFTRTQAQCTTAGGVYRGDNTSCSAANCTPPGACCFPDGSCVVVPQSRCVSASGVYHGDSSVCATAGCWSPPVLWNNAKIITNPGAGAGGLDASAIPTGAATIGENQALTAAVRVADNFTIPSGETWTINKFIVEGYQTGSTTTSTFTQIVVRIWDRIPSDPNAVSLFGDITTNLINLNESAFSNIYRVTTVLTDAQRPVMKIVADVPNVQLGAGTYWVEWATAGSLASGPFIPLVTLPNFLPTGNAIIWRNAPWVPVVDTGINLGEYPSGQPVDLPFIVQGSRAVACYANCDGSTTPPILNVNDFTCFLNKYAAGDPYANCDGSTTPPILNVNDFTCFLNKYAIGCP